MKKCRLQRNLAHRTGERVRGNLLDPATSARFSHVSGQVVEETLVERSEAESESHQVRVVSRLQVVQ